MALARITRVIPQLARAKSAPCAFYHENVSDSFNVLDQFFKCVIFSYFPLTIKIFIFYLKGFGTLRESTECWIS